MGVMGEAVVVEMRVGQNDRGHVRRGRVVRKDAGDITQDALGDQVRRGPLRRVPWEVAAVGGYERHAQVEQDARAVVCGDLDTHAADLMLAAMNQIARNVLLPTAPVVGLTLPGSQDGAAVSLSTPRHRCGQSVDWRNARGVRSLSLRPL